MIERAGSHHGKPVTQIVLLPHEVLDYFAETVGVQRAERSFLIHRQLRRLHGSVFLTGSHNQCAGYHAQTSELLQDVKLESYVVLQGEPRIGS